MLYAPICAGALAAHARSSSDFLPAVAPDDEAAALVGVGLDGVGEKVVAVGPGQFDTAHGPSLTVAL